jgi:hypothetical protein
MAVVSQRMIYDPAFSHVAAPRVKEPGNRIGLALVVESEYWPAGVSLEAFKRGAVMRRICVLLVVLFLAGCASDGKPHWYDEALKDARGDNMQMRGFNTGDAKNK